MADVNLVGRDAGLAALRSFLSEAVVDGATLLLTGEPGVGKTALLSAAATMTTTDGVRVIRGGGVAYETDVSFVGRRLRGSRIGLHGITDTHKEQPDADLLAFVQGVAGGSPSSEMAATAGR